MSEYESEPIPGLPETLPDGEKLLWQGSPGAAGVAKRVLHANAVAAYFALLALLPLASALLSGGSVGDAVLTSLRVIVAGGAGLAILIVLAKLIARTTVYSITSKRVVMRYGVAFPMTLNIPFNEITAVDCKAYADGSGDLALVANGPLRLSYLHLWPHARGWHFDPAQPTLRVVPDGAHVAKVLVDAMVAAGMQGSPARVSRSVQASNTAQPIHDLNAATA